mmetsp:Transcript_46556/g.145977  ORF Transcript_46556/g.145977 Transcript_46556/m.145977 type:complete len:320 (+) Transcript_46556:1815-2774(+)
MPSTILTTPPSPLAEGGDLKGRTMRKRSVRVHGCARHGHVEGSLPHYLVADAIEAHDDGGALRPQDQRLHALHIPSEHLLPIDSKQNVSALYLAGVVGGASLVDALHADSSPAHLHENDSHPAHLRGLVLVRGCRRVALPNGRPAVSLLVGRLEVPVGRLRRGRGRGLLALHGRWLMVSPSSRRRRVLRGLVELLILQLLRILDPHARHENFTQSHRLPHHSDIDHRVFALTPQPEGDGRASPAEDQRTDVVDALVLYADPVDGLNKVSSQHTSAASCRASLGDGGDTEGAEGSWDQHDPEAADRTVRAILVFLACSCG